MRNPKKYQPVTTYHFTRIYMTIRIFGSKFGWTKAVAHSITTEVAVLLSITGFLKHPHLIRLICERCLAYLNKTRKESLLTPEEFEDIYIIYTHIETLSLSRLAEYPYIVDELLKKNPTLLNDNMKQLWELYKKGSYTEEEMRIIMKKQKLAYNAIRHGMFLRLLAAYDQLPNNGI